MSFQYVLFCRKHLWHNACENDDYQPYLVWQFTSQMSLLISATLHLLSKVNKTASGK